MRKIFTLAGVCLLCILFAANSLQAQNRFRPEQTRLDEIQKTVETSREAWQQIFPSEELPDYGFRNQQEMQSATPGKPIEVFAMFRNFEGKIETQPTGEFLVPLLVDGKPRVFLTVAFFENKYQVVSVGEMNLAKETSAYLGEATQGKTQLVWLRNLNHNADFIADANSSFMEGNLQFIPLSTAQRATFTAPLAYVELVSRISKMVVQFD